MQQQPRGMRLKRSGGDITQQAEGPKAESPLCNIGAERAKVASGIARQDATKRGYSFLTI